MSLKLEDIKHVDIKSHILMNGYLRILCIDQDDNDHIIPDLVLHICLLFYYPREHFSFSIDACKQISPNFKFSDDKKTVVLIDKCYGTVYGNIKIDSLSEDICKWNIKVYKNDLHQGSDYTKYLSLGISGDEPHDQYIDSWNKMPPNSFLCVGNGKIYGSSECVMDELCINNKPIWTDGDIVGIKLNLKQRNIEYYINNENIGIIYKNIPIGKDIKYRLITTMTHNGHCASIQSHEYLYKVEDDTNIY